MRRLRGSARVAVLAGVAAAVAIVATVLLWRDGDHTGSAGARSGSSRLEVTEDYLPGLGADLYLPDGVRTAPVVVLLPGGSWQTADRSGLGPLAQSLAAAGMVAVNATYRAAVDGGGYPAMVQEAVCAVDFAADRARRGGVTPGRVVVVGHSAGGQLAAMAALVGSRFRGDCPYPAARIDGLIGLAGAYDVRRVPEIAGSLFGETEQDDPARWREGNPLTWVGERPAELSVLLLHGQEDDVLPVEMTQDFASALRSARHAVEVQVVSDVDHMGIFLPNAVSGRIVTWVRGL